MYIETVLSIIGYDVQVIIRVSLCENIARLLI
jgi:hypothetical protein